jgi:leucyl/phenylalanyl-tRNA--protein transferase
LRIFLLDESNRFPDPHLATPEGLLAIGGDLSNQRLLAAYEQGIFPWYSEGEPIMWWSPDPRFVLFPNEIHISRSMRPYLNNPAYSITLDNAFDKVIEHCSRIFRDGQEGTWITREMKEAYISLHQAGYAHSLEVWENKELVGGLYGISLGRCFFGESMFSLKKNASKIALIKLVEQLIKWNFDLIDCQQQTEHLATMGARAISRDDFLSYLSVNKSRATRKGLWRFGDE